MMASAVLNARLRQYLAAEEAILVGGQSYKIGNRTLTRADLTEIRKEIDALLAAGATTDSGIGRGRKSKRVIMRD